MGRIYAYYEVNEQMLASNLRDAAEIPILAELMSAFAAYQDGVRSTLRRGWRVRRRRRARLEARCRQRYATAASSRGAGPT